MQTVGPDAGVDVKPRHIPEVVLQKDEGVLRQVDIGPAD